jgi:hypothetical protein
MHIFISQPYDDFAFQKDLNFISKSFPIQFKSLPFKPQLNLNIQTNFQKLQVWKVLRKLFKFISSLLLFKFGLNAFESLTFKLKSLFERLEK